MHVEEFIENDDVFEIADYTNASPWEKFIAQIETILKAWGANRGAKSEFGQITFHQNAAKPRLCERLSYENREYYLAYYDLTDFQESQGNSSDGKLAEAMAAVAAAEASMPSGTPIVSGTDPWHEASGFESLLFDVMGESSWDPASDRHAGATCAPPRDAQQNPEDDEFGICDHPIARLFGVKRFIAFGPSKFVTSGGWDAVHMDPSEHCSLLSAITVAATSLCCPVPVFIPSRDTSIPNPICPPVSGNCGHETVRVRYDWDLASTPPAGCTHLVGILDLLLTKIHRPQLQYGSVIVSARCTYQFGAAFTSADPILSLQLNTLWTRQPATHLVDNPTCSQLSPDAAPTWKLRAITTNDFRTPAANSLGSMLRLFFESIIHESKQSMKKRGGKGDKRGAKSDKPSSQKYWTLSNSDEISFIQTLLCELPLLDKHPGQDSTDLLFRSLDTLFPGEGSRGGLEAGSGAFGETPYPQDNGADADADVNGSDRNPRDSGPDVFSSPLSTPSASPHTPTTTSVRSKENPRSTYVNKIKCAPPKSLTSAISDLMAYQDSLGGAKTFWSEVVSEIRWKWNEREMLPHLSATDRIDFSYSILWQYMTMVNVCIKMVLSTKETQKQVETDWNDNWSDDDDDADGGDDDNHSYISHSSQSDRGTQAARRTQRGRGRGKPSGGDKLARGTTNNSGSEGDDDDEFHDAAGGSSGDEAVSKKSKVEGGSLPDGAAEALPGLKLLETGKQMYRPVTQELPFMTEDMALQQEEFFTKFGSSEEGSKKRMRMQTENLLSDMQGFKACNEGATLADFVRWYSPRDWIDGELSVRMKEPDNLWRQLWAEAVPIPAAQQTPLCDYEAVGNEIVEKLQSMSFTQVLLELLVIRCGLMLDRLSTQEGAHVSMVKEALSYCAEQLSHVRTTLRSMAYEPQTDPSDSVVDGHVSDLGNNAEAPSKSTSWEHGADTDTPPPPPPYPVMSVTSTCEQLYEAWRAFARAEQVCGKATSLYHKLPGISTRTAEVLLSGDEATFRDSAFGNDDDDDDDYGSSDDRDDIFIDAAGSLPSSRERRSSASERQREGEGRRPREVEGKRPSQSQPHPQPGCARAESSPAAAGSQSLPRGAGSVGGAASWEAAADRKVVRKAFIDNKGMNPTPDVREFILRTSIHMTGEMDSVPLPQRMYVRLARSGVFSVALAVSSDDALR
eukprot:Rmarinus@m.26720